MKARFIALAALVLGLASCQNDFEAGNVVAGGEVDFQLSVSAPELVGTRAGEDGKADNQNAMDSAFGAIDYLQGAAAGDDRQDWEEDADLRYVLEVYDYKEDGIYDGAVPVKDRMVIIKDSYEPVAFNLRLAPNRQYHFVVFADFVAEGSAEKTPAEQLDVVGIRHKIGTTLANIEVINEAINDEVADAYFATKKIEVTNVAVYDNIELKRPYGKLRVIATDLAELNLNVHPAKVEVKYNAYNPNTFNAVTGAISGAYVQEFFTTNFVEKVRDNMDKHFYTVGYDAKTTKNLKGEERRSHITLFTDYILAEDAQKPITFTMTAYDGTGLKIKETAFNTAIPVQRNYLTTIIGNVLTTATEVEVTINDNFAGEMGEPQLHTILETLINGGEFTLTEDLEINVPTTLNGDAIINLNGHKLTYTIPAEYQDKNHELWSKYMIMTRVAGGSSLTFVGDGEVVSDGYIASANKDGNKVGKVYVNGGKYSGDTCTLFQANGGEVYIYGGEFKAAEYDGDYRYTLNHVDSQKTVGKIEVTGGKFYKYDPAQSASENPVMDFVPKGFGAYPEGDWYVVKPVSEANYTAKLGSSNSGKTSDYVKSLIVAIFHNGGNLTIERNVNNYDDVATFDKALIAAKGDVVLNFTGTDLADDAYLKANYVYVENKVAALISAQDGATVTINGNGNIDGGADDYAVEARNGGKVVLNGGNYVGAATAVQAAYNGEVTINGGTYSLNENVDTFGYTYLLNLKDNTGASIKVYGGKFKKFNPMDNAAENPQVSFCADGCAVFANGEYWEVYNIGVNVKIDAVVESTDQLKAALEDANVNVVALKAGTYDLNDKIYYLAKAKTLVSYNTEKALVKGKIVANADFSAYNIAFASNSQTTSNLNTSTYGSKVNGTYASIITLNKAAGTFEGCEFSDYPQAAINYFVEITGKELHVNKCKFTGGKAIYSKVLCEVTNCEFITNDGVPVYVWPRHNDVGFVTVKDNAMGLSYCQLGFLSQSGAYDNLTVDVQGNTGEFTYTFSWTNTATFNMSGITFAPGSKTFSK